MGTSCSIMDGTAINQIATVKKQIHTSRKIQDVPHFTNTDINILRKQWPVFMANADANGTCVFEKIFTREQTLMAKFTFAITLMFDINKTIKDARLLFHVRRVFFLIDEVIDSLGNEDDFNDAINHVERVGKRHFQLGLKEENFEVFKAAFLDQLKDLLHVHFDEVSMEIWTKLLCKVIHHMNTGLMKGRMEDCQIQQINTNEKKTDL